MSKRIHGTKYFGRMDYNFNRGIKEIYTIHDLNKTEWLRIRNDFDNKCAFCGIDDTGNTRTGLVADHLIAAKDGGDYTFGNIVPACHTCNDTRGKKKWKQFMYDKFSENADSRIRKIDSYIRDKNYEPAEPENRMNAEDLVTYQNLIRDWDDLLLRAKKLKLKVEKYK